MFESKKPYYDLPLLPPAQDLESLELYKMLVPAAAALAELSATAEHLPNQAALYESVILLEAKASSEIEQVVTTDSKLFAPSHTAMDPMTKEVRRYGEAVRLGWHSEKPLCTPVMEEICTIIKDKPMAVRRVPGIALSNERGEIIYTPPDGAALLRDLLDNLFKWMNDEDDVHPIIKAAIAHYQFESIHPFTDGNGRTGRIMGVLYLVEQKLLNAPVLFLSGEILKDKPTYYSLLQELHHTNDFMPYLMWFVELMHRAALQSTIRANGVRLAMADMKIAIRDLDPKMYSQDLVNVLFLSPIIFAQNLVDYGAANSLQTARNYLNKLEDEGVVVRHNKLFDRKVGYINLSLVEALSDEIDLN